MSALPRWFRYASLLAALVLGGFRCDRPPKTPAEPAPKAPTPLGRPDVSLLLVTDPKGYLEPCGCQQRPLGGVDKLAHVVAQVRAEGPPAVLLAAGNLLFGAELHGADVEGARTQELWKAETLASIWGEDIGMAAAAPGPLDFGEGLETAASLRSRGGFPWLSCNLEGAEPPLAASALLEVGPHKLGVVGSHGELRPGAWPAPLQATADDARVKREVQALRDQGAALVVALHHGDRRSARAVARAGADLVVLGGLDERDPIPPIEQSGALIVHAGRQGQRVLRVDVALGGQGPLVDVSEWSLEHERVELQRRIEALAAKVEAWERDPNVDAADLAAQKARLAQLQAEMERVRRPDHQGRWVAARLIDLDPDVKSDTKVAARMDAHDKRVNQHNKKALADRTPTPPKEGEPHYVGSERCGSCHAPAMEWWQKTPHGNAYATLERLNKEYNLSCVGCHVTGYNEPGGSTVTHVEGLKNVGCESCHGPGSAHAKQPAAKGLVQTQVPEATCLTCHTPEHSARFDYESFVPLLIAPGHGKPPPGSAGSAP